MDLDIALNRRQNFFNLRIKTAKACLDIIREDAKAWHILMGNEIDIYFPESYMRYKNAVIKTMEIE